MILHRSLLPLSMLLLLAACGGGQPTQPTTPPGVVTPARSLHYTAPATHTRAWRLELVEGQDTPRLVFRLMGPEDQSIRGLSLFLKAEGTAVAWQAARPGTALDPGKGMSLFRDRTRPEGLLQAGIYQKQGAGRLDRGPVLLLTLDLKTGAAKGPVPWLLQAESELMEADGSTTPLPGLDLGTLQAQ